MKTAYWDRRPGYFVNITSGQPLNVPSFGGNQQDWYYTLFETIKTVWPQSMSSQGCNIITSYDIHCILENLANYRPCIDYDNVQHDSSYLVNNFDYMGTLSNKIRIYCDNNVIRNEIEIYSPINKTKKPDASIIVKGMEIF